MAFIDYVEHTSLFVPHVLSNSKLKVNGVGYVHMTHLNNNRTLLDYFNINQVIRKDTLRKRFTDSVGYALKYKDKYYYVTCEFIYECADLDQDNIIVTKILVAYGYILNPATKRAEQSLLVHSSFDMSILKKRLWYTFGPDAQANIIIIQRNLFDYLTKVEKNKSYTYFNDNVIPTLKQSYLQQLEQLIAEYDG